MVSGPQPPTPNTRALSHADTDMQYSAYSANTSRKRVSVAKRVLPSQIPIWARIGLGMITPEQSHIFETPFSLSAPPIIKILLQDGHISDAPGGIGVG